MQMFMIACHMDSIKNVVGFRIIDTDTGEVKDFDYKAVKAVLEQGIHIDGIKLECGKLKGSNGAFNRYTQLYNGVTISSCPVVIVKEYPDKIYDVCNHLGQIVKMSVNDIITFASREGLANGKIMTNASGKYISSISGEYPKDKSFKEIEYGEKTKAKMLLLGIEDIEFDNNNYVRALEDNIESASVGRGCLGVAEKGFINCKRLKTVNLPSTCINFGRQAFFGCISLEEINIPEGTKVIPSMCFMNCKRLKRITLPNSLRTIESRAFFGCDSLVEVSFGPVKPNIEGQLPLKTKITFRR